MWDIIIVVALVIIVFGGFTLVYWQLNKEHERKELAKKNMSFLESIHLTGLPIITFHNNDCPVNMVLDTGSNVCLINNGTLNNLSYKNSEMHSGVIGVSGETEGGQSVFLQLKYKDFNFNFECNAVDMEDTVKAIKKEYGVTIHGLLGTEFFTKYKYIIDFNDMVAYSLKKD